MYRGWRGNAYAYNIQAGHINGDSDLGVPSSWDLQELADMAYSYMKPKVNDGSSLVNFILELKDLKHLNPIPSVQRIVNNSSVGQALRNPARRGKFTRELTTRLNNAHLGAQFGINPLVGDISSMYNELVMAGTKLAMLKKYAGRQRKAHFKCLLPLTNGLVGGTSWKQALTNTTIAWPSGLSNDWLGSGGVRSAIKLNRFSRFTQPPVYHATMRYSYTLPQAGSALETVYYYMDLLGIRLDPSIIWNAIPFSFVVDWVVDVGGFLGSFARDNFPIEVRIHDFCHSIKWSRETYVDAHYATDAALDTSARFQVLPKDPPPVRVYSGTYSYYNRQGAVPSSSATVRLKTPGLKQAALSGSLLLTRTSYGSATGYRYRR
jgi:hypothetical protein